MRVKPTVLNCANALTANNTLCSWLTSTWLHLGLRQDPSLLLFFTFIILLLYYTLHFSLFSSTLSLCSCKSCSMEAIAILDREREQYAENECPPPLPKWAVQWKSTTRRCAATSSHPLLAGKSMEPTVKYHEILSLFLSGLLNRYEISYSYRTHYATLKCLSHWSTSKRNYTTRKIFTVDW